MPYFFHVCREEQNCYEKLHGETNTDCCSSICPPYYLRKKDALCKRVKSLYRYIRNKLCEWMNKHEECLLRATRDTRSIDSPPKGQNEYWSCDSQNYGEHELPQIYSKQQHKVLHYSSNWKSRFRKPSNNAQSTWQGTWEESFMKKSEVKISWPCPFNLGKFRQCDVLADVPKLRSLICSSVSPCISGFIVIPWAARSSI